MHSYLSRLSLVAGIFILSIGVGVLVTQEGGRVPLLPDQIALTAGIYEFTWSPDGKSIAYISTQGGQSEIWIVGSAGGPSKRITSTGTAKKHPRWSQDGKWIAYVAMQPGGPGDIEIASPDGETITNLTETPADDRAPEWAPDSRHIAYIERARSRTRILAIDVDSRMASTITEANATEIQWSPDGKSIVFVSDPLLSNDDRRDNEDIFMVPAAGGNPRLLTPGTPRFRDFAVSWSPDSQRITFVSDSTGYSNIFVLDTQNGSRRNINSSMTDDIRPRWSPDGSNIAYIRNENSQFNIWVMKPQGGNSVRVSNLDGVNGGFEVDNAAPHGYYEWAPDSKRIAFTHADPGRTSDIWVTTLDGRATQITNSMPADLRRPARFVWPEMTTYRSFDGTEVRGLVYKPRGSKPRMGYPALLMFRDALDGQNAVGWDPFIQFFVSDGYAVFAPNVRGSSGRGKNFHQLIFERGGDDDVRDAFVGLDKLSSEGTIDAGHVGIFGAGIGGFLTTAALIKDEARFKAAVCLYGIVDAVTAASFSSSGNWFRYMIGATPLSNPLPYYERSLVNFVDKLRTPIIFFYTGGDLLVPSLQLQEFAVQAEVKGKWFDYRVFDNESEEWPYWRPNSLRQTLEGMDALFEKHLMGRDREIRLTRNR